VRPASKDGFGGDMGNDEREEGATEGGAAAGAGVAAAAGLPSSEIQVGRCRFTASKSVLKAPMVSALEAKTR